MYKYTRKIYKKYINVCETISVCKIDFIIIEEMNQSEYVCVFLNNNNNKH